MLKKELIKRKNTQPESNEPTKPSTQAKIEKMTEGAIKDELPLLKVQIGRISLLSDDQSRV